MTAAKAISEKHDRKSRIKGTTGLKKTADRRALPILRNWQSGFVAVFGLWLLVFDLDKAG